MATAATLLPRRLPGAGRETGAFRFIVVNDLHHGSESCDAFCSTLVGHMQSQGDIAFCLILGDLADRGLPKSLAAVRYAFDQLGAPAYTVPGNHDCDAEQTTRLYDEAFPGRLNYHFAHGDWQFVGLDTTDGNKWRDVVIQPATLDWLDITLPELDPVRPTVLFTHFPLASEANPQLAPLNPGDVLQRFAGFNLRAAFSGHYHARTEFNRASAALLTNACCSRVRDNHDGSIPEGYLVCTARNDGALARAFIRFSPAENSLQQPQPPAANL